MPAGQTTLVNLRTIALPRLVRIVLSFHRGAKDNYG